MEKSLNNNSVIVNAESVKEFGNKIIEENNKLLDIVIKMYNDSLRYVDMVDNKAGNLYKEVMLRELLKEREKIINGNAILDKTFKDIYETYSETYDSIENSVRG